MPDQARHLPLFGAGGEEADAEDDTRKLPGELPGGLPGRLPGPASFAAHDPAGLVHPPPAPAGSGALLRCAWPLIALLARLRPGAEARDPEALKAATAERVRGFEQAALTGGLDPRQVSAARYTLCTAIDEAVSTSAWGERSGWARASLLSMFHGETWGGEKVFTLIERALAEPRRYTELLELFYFVLAAGFQGKFRRERDGTAAVDALREQIRDALQGHFGTRAALPAPARAEIGRQARLIRYVPVWSVGVVCLLLSLLLLAGLVYQLDNESQGVVRQFAAVAAP